MEIYIMSSGRPNKQITWDSLPEELQRRVKIAVPPDEVSAYSKYPTISSPNLPRHLPRARDWVAQSVAKKVIMMDDDITFATRRKDDPTKFLPSSPYEIVSLFDEMEAELDDFVHVGIGRRGGGHFNTARRYEVGRMNCVLGYRTDFIRKHQLVFSATDSMEDLDMTLQLLRLGMPNPILNHTVFNHSGTGTTPGGCAQYRTLEMQAQSAHKLYALHKPFVTVIEKASKTTWSGGLRTEVRIQWRRAYESRPR